MLPAKNLLVVALAGLTPAVGAITMRMIVGGQCGESELACTFPGCDEDLLGSSATQIIDGLEVGNCADAGFTVPAGATTSGDCAGVHGCVDVTLYAPTGAVVCFGDQLDPLVRACAAFDDADDPAVCGSQCETEARALMVPGSCFAAGDMHSMLDSVTSMCSGYVPVAGDGCNSGLYFQAYINIPDGAFDWRTIRDFDFDSLDPDVEHADHMPDFSFLSDDAFVSDIDGFSEVDRYIMRWEGSFAAGATGPYGFSTNSDDGSMLYIDGVVIVDNDGVHAANRVDGSVQLTAGSHDIVITFFENSGGALLEVTFTPPGGSETVLSADVLSNSIGCGDDTGMLVGVDDRCAIDYCIDERDCPRCTSGLQCRSAESGDPCAGTCFGRCVAVDTIGCSTCDELNWPDEGDGVCAESDGQGMPGWSSCENALTQASAEEHCLSVGSRLCSAEELFENAEGTGTGCGHDNRLIWSSSSELHSGGINLQCSTFEKLVIPGNMATAASHSLAPACVNIDEVAAALRCCADTVCDGTELAPNLVELAEGLPDFTTLIAAVVAGGLADTLSGPGPFTVFAPTNEAFAALGQEAINALLADHDQLVDLLTYHVVSGAVLSSDLMSGDRFETLEGQQLTVRVSSFGGLDTFAIESFGSTANIVQADVQASNGVVHVIDTVLIPSSGPPSCATCGQLGWADGGDGVCGESDDGFSCETDVTFEEAHTACEAFGARLCTASELLAREGQGTGCGHDARYVWSTSTYDDSITCEALGVDTQVLAIQGNQDNPGAAGVCLDPITDTASLRCCADTVCPDATDVFDNSGCVCNGATGLTGGSGPDCASLYQGRPHCYVDPGTCSDGTVSSQVPPNEWSFAACETTVYIINADGQCGESTFPSTWATAALAWVATQRMTVTVGDCTSQGYTEAAGSQTVPGTGAPSDPVVTLYTQPVAQTTVYIINADGQCGESTFPSTWATAALAWVATQRMTVTVGDCASQGYTEATGSSTTVPGTGAPSDPVVTLYTAPGGH